MNYSIKQCPSERITEKCELTRAVWRRGPNHREQNKKVLACFVICHWFSLPRGKLASLLRFCTIVYGTIWLEMFYGASLMSCFSLNIRDMQVILSYTEERGSQKFYLHFSRVQ